MRIHYMQRQQLGHRQTAYHFQLEPREFTKFINIYHSLITRARAIHLYPLHHSPHYDYAPTSKATEWCLPIVTICSSFVCCFCLFERQTGIR